MGELLIAIVALFSITALLAIKVSRYIWLLFAMLLLITLQALGMLNWYLAVFAWLLVAGALSLSCIATLRQRLIIRPLFKLFKNKLPAMSSTEQQAIAAGDSWIEADLLQGQLNWSKLLQQPMPNLTAKEQQFLDQQVAKFCSMLDDWQITHEQLDLPAKAWQYLKEQRFLAMLIPVKYGGLGFSPLANSTIVQKIATRSLTAAVTVMVPNSLGPAELLLKYGTKEQQEHYLPKLASGEHIPAFALTAQDAGSDAGAISDNGIICYGTFNGKRLIGLRLNWSKRYITLAPVATLLGLAVKVFDPDCLLGDETELGITVCLLPTDLPGVTVDKRHLPLNQAFMNGPTTGKDVFVPLNHVIGGINMIGKGWQMLVGCLSAGRGISLPALSTAFGKLCFTTTSAYSVVRQQFGLSIGKFEGIEAALAKIGGLTYRLEATRLLTLAGLHQGYSPAVITAVAKYHMTEMSRTIVNHAMDVHGGKAIMLGNKNYLGRAYQGVPIAITVEGANILTRNLIIFGQGVIRAHPYLKNHIYAISNTDEQAGISQFDYYLHKNIAYTLSNCARVLLHSVTGKYFCNKEQLTDTSLNKYCQNLSFMSIALAVVCDLSLVTLGGQLKRKERLSARLGDVLSHLYMAVAIVKYYHSCGSKQELPFVKWNLQYSLYQIQTAMLKFLQNLPNKIIATFIKILVFPFGSRFQMPADCLESELSKLMQQNSNLRERIAKDCYMDQDYSDAVGKVEQAFQAALAAQPSLAKIIMATKKGKLPKQQDLKLQTRMALEMAIIDEQDSRLINEYEKARIEAIVVDDFMAQQLINKDLLYA